MITTLIIASLVLAVLALLPLDRPVADESDEAAEEPPARLRLKPTRQR
jgi:hypothetical protein